MISLLRCAAALFAVFWFSLPVQVQSSIPGFSGPRDTRSAARFQTPVVAGGNAANALTPAERAAGWTLLFDGRSLAGWQPTTPGWPYDVIADRTGEAWAGNEFNDRIVRLNPVTGRMIEYLLPRQTNVRRVWVDNRTNPVTFWVGNNHGASIVKLEPLD